jgi:hypothetical protein
VVPLRGVILGGGFMQTMDVSVSVIPQDWAFLGGGASPFGGGASWGDLRSLNRPLRGMRERGRYGKLAPSVESADARLIQRTAVFP